MRFQVANRGEHIVVKGGVVEIGLARTARPAESAEVDCQDLESAGYQGSGLIPPAFLVESATVSEYNGAGAFAIEIGVNLSTILGREGDGLLCAASAVSTSARGRARRAGMREVYRGWCKRSNHSKMAAPRRETLSRRCAPALAREPPDRMLFINVSYVMWTLPPMRRRHQARKRPHRYMDLGLDMLVSTSQAPRQVVFHRAFTPNECFP